MTKLLDFVLSQEEQFRRLRLPSLYSDFHLQRYTNPDGFAANVTAWEEVLQKATWAGLIPSDTNGADILSLTVGEKLLQLLETKEWGRPLSLAIVIDEAVSKHSMIPMLEFQRSAKGNNDKVWRAQPWSLISWCFRELGFTNKTLSPGKIQNGQFVILANVEKAASRVLMHVSRQTSQAERTYSIERFREVATKALELSSTMTEHDLSVLLVYLAREKEAICYDQQIVKFGSCEGNLHQLTDEDRTVVRLRTLIDNLDIQVKQITTRVIELSNEAQKAVLIKDRQSTLRALRSRKMAQNSLGQKTQTVSQLEEIYNKIKEAADQVAVIRAIKSGTEVLHNLHAQIGGVENVEDIMEELQRELTIGKDINDVIEKTSVEASDVNEDAIDEELELLERRTRHADDERRIQQVQETLAGVTLPEESKIVRTQATLEKSQESDNLYPAG